MKADDIILKHAIMHILDTDAAELVLSDEEMELTPDVFEFLKVHIAKVTDSDECRRRCVFDNASPMMPLISGANEENFVATSKEMATQLYDIMKDSAIPAGDIIILVFSCEGIDYLGMLKLNYKSSMTHQKTDKGIVLGSAKGLLPGSSTRLSEAFFVNLENGEIQMAEKAFEVMGTKTNYLSTLFLQCHTRPSEKKKLNAVDKAVESVAKKHYGDDAPREQMEIRRVMCDELSKPEGLKVEEIPFKLFPDSPVMQEEVKEKLEQVDLSTAVIAPQTPATVKKYKSQRLTTDTGIEIKIPMEAYEDHSQFELIFNPDGSRSILIKNITKLTTR